MCVILAFVGCLFVVKPGFENAHLIPALIGVCGGLGAGIAYTMVRKMGTHGVKGSVIVFYFSCFSCIIVIPWIVFHYQPMSLRQLLTLLLAGLLQREDSLRSPQHIPMHPLEKISIFDYSQIIFATLLGFLFIRGDSGSIQSDRIWIDHSGFTGKFSV